MKRLLKIIFPVIFVFLLIYLCGVVLFWNKFVPGTTVNNKSVGLLSPNEVALNLIQDTSQTLLVFIRRGGSIESFTYEELGVFSPSDLKITNVSISGWLWPIRIFSPKSYVFEKNLDYDYNLLKNTILHSDSFTSEYLVEPEDAAVVQDSNGRFQLVSAKKGNILDEKRVLDVVCNALSENKNIIDLDQSGCYTSVKKDDDYPDIELPDEIVGSISDIEISMGDNCVEVLTKEMITGMIVNYDGKNFLRYKVLNEYVSELADKYNTIGMIREFKTSLGNIINIQPSDIDTYMGWELYKEATLSEIGSALLNNQNEISAIWKNTGKTHNSDSDLGLTYIEISLDDQHLWYYQDGICMFETNVVTGLPDEKRITPSGLFRTLDFYEDYTMNDYWGSAFVKYFIRLTPNGIGIHDASWRSNFDKSEYITNGSHGCINIPSESMPDLYHLIKEQTPQSIPVIIY